MSLTVLSVAYPMAPVSPDAIGGAEQVVARLDRALTRAGHQSLVVACQGSSVSGTLLPTPRVQGQIDEHARETAHKHVCAAIAAACKQWHVDLIHLHGIDFASYLPEGDIPVLVTLHLPSEWYPAPIFTIARPHTWLNCVSESQRRRCPDCALLLPTIENGVETEVFRPRHHKMRFALLLGRVCPEKGFHLALEAAARAGIGCLIGGEIFRYPSHQQYFTQELAPRLDGRARRFLGPIGITRKRRLLAASSCLLIPSLAPETSSLVAMEALACGTPVIAFPAGALADIVDHGKTGYLVHNEREMAAAIEQAHAIKPDDCRAAAEARFSSGRMIANYFQTYREISCRRFASSRVCAEQSLRTDVITDPHAFASIEPEWSRLFTQCPAASPFSSPQWLLAWWSVFGGAALETIIVRAGDELVGVLPLYRFNGSQYVVGNGITDYLDCLTREDVAPAVAEQLWLRLGPCDLHDVPQDSALIRYAPPRFAANIVSGSRCYAKNLLEPECSPKLLPSIRSSRRKLEQLGQVVIEQAHGENVFEHLETLFRLHGARWEAKNDSGVLGNADVQRFHRHAAGALSDAGMLRLVGLRINGQIRAGLYCLVRNRRTYYYAGGFDPELAAYGLGSLLIQHAITTAREAGHTEFDFLRGEEAYKIRWGARARPNYNIIIR